MKKRTLASPLLNAALLRRFARPRRVRKVFGAKGERVRTSAAYPLVLTVMRRRALDLQICDGALNLEARDVQRDVRFMAVRDVRFMADHEHMEHAVRSISTTGEPCEHDDEGLWPRSA